MQVTELDNYTEEKEDTDDFAVLTAVWNGRASVYYLPVMSLQSLFISLRSLESSMKIIARESFFTKFYFSLAKYLVSFHGKN